MKERLPVSHSQYSGGQYGIGLSQLILHQKSIPLLSVHNPVPLQIFVVCLFRRKFARFRQIDESHSSSEHWDLHHHDMYCEYSWLFTRLNNKIS